MNNDLERDIILTVSEAAPSLTAGGVVELLKSKLGPEYGDTVVMARMWDLIDRGVLYLPSDWLSLTVTEAEEELPETLPNWLEELVEEVIDCFEAEGGPTVESLVGTKYEAGLLRIIIQVPVKIWVNINAVVGVLGKDTTVVASSEDIVFQATVGKQDLEIIVLMRNIPAFQDQN